MSDNRAFFVGSHNQSMQSQKSGIVKLILGEWPDDHLHLQLFANFKVAYVCIQENMTNDGLLKVIWFTLLYIIFHTLASLGNA